MQFKTIPADKAIDLYEVLTSARRLQLQPALNQAVKELNVASIDRELNELVPERALSHVASLGLRGERVFPVPSIIHHSPLLIGYYRMLLGISKKEFRQTNKLSYGPWVSAEEKGTLSNRVIPELPRFCSYMIEPLVKLVYAMDTFEDRDLSDLTLLTLGSTLQGGRNNVIGLQASEAVFQSLRSLVGDWITFDSGRIIRFEPPDGGHYVLIEGDDPDVRLDLTTSEGDERPIAAIEIKGGEDSSNAHNRAGEAEKSHIKATTKGYGHLWTIMVMKGLNRESLGEETPSSTKLFDAVDVISQSGPDWDSFREKFVGAIGGPFSQ